MKQLQSLCILLLFACTSFAQGTDKLADNEKEKPYIEVNGIAEKEIVPDEIYIAITLRERQEARETITIEKQETDLKAALSGMGIPMDNLMLSDANADFIRVKVAKKDVVLQSEYLLKLPDATTVAKVFEKLDELKILDAYISKVSHSKIEEFKKEVRINAIKAAKNKADYLLDAIGEKTGKPLIINEVFQGAPSYQLYANSIERGRSYGVPDLQGWQGAYEDKKVIQFQKIKLRTQIYVKFEIK